MPIRSRIEKVQPDGTVKSIYCHWDGYPDHVGVVFYGHYTDEAKIDTLLALGDISYLGPEIGEKHENHDKNVVTAYARDRDETDCEARIDDNLGSFLELLAQCSEEYTYLYDGGEWGYYTGKERFLRPMAGWHIA